MEEFHYACKFNRGDNMWCGGCQQDVPGIVPQGEQSLICCARCNEPLQSARHSNESEASELAEVDFQPFVISDWRLDDDLHEINRRLKSLRRLPNSKPRLPTEPKPSSPVNRSPVTKKNHKPLRQWLGNTLLIFGLLAVAAGAGLMAAFESIGGQWSWNVGIGLLVGGNTVGMLSMLLRGNALNHESPAVQSSVVEVAKSNTNAATDSYAAWQLRLEQLMKQPVDRAA